MDHAILFQADRQVTIFRRILFLLSLVIAFYSFTVYADRVSDKIYTKLQSKHYCSRRLNATHQMGCTSDLGGNLGVVWIVEDQLDLDHILKTGSTPPYMAILRREHYTRQNLLTFKANPDRVSGVVFLDDNHDDSKLRSIPFSPEDRCPNRYAGLYINDTQYGNCKRNLWLKESQISGLLYDDIPYPIFLINEKKSITDIESCFLNNIVRGSRRQDSYPLCSMQLDSFMLAASETRTCLNSRSFVDELFQSPGQRCYTVENRNIFSYYKPVSGFLQPTNRTNIKQREMVDSQSVILLTAKLSSFSMFTELSPGADSTIVPIVTMLAIAQALGKRKNDKNVLDSKRNIAFALLDSEPFDYTGSSRMVYNMKNGMFPYGKYIRSENTEEKKEKYVKNTNLTALEYVINLDQLTNYPNSSEIYLHIDPNDKDSPKLERIIEILSAKASSQQVDLRKYDPTLPLPPTPVHEFIRKSRSETEENRLLGLVLANYGETFTNLFYNSVYDDKHNVHQASKEKLVEHIARVATFIAKSLYELSFGSLKQGDIVADKVIIEELLKCYLEDAECGLFTKAWHAGQKLPNEPIQTYKDPTKQSDDMNGAITANLLAYFIGDIMKDYNLTKCNQENEESMEFNFQYLNDKDEPINDVISGGVCVRSQVIPVASTSPAFAVTEQTITVDERYPAWTVSLNSIRNPARLFMKPSPIQEWCIFFVGVVITIMSFVTVYHVNNFIK